MTRREILALLASSAANAAAPAAFERLSLDLRTGVLDAARWPDAQQHPVFPGSLVKPFTALAHGAPFPKVLCKGCRPGTVHGQVDLVTAIAQSCNRYFEELAQRVTHQRACLIAANYGLPAPPDEPDARIGLGRNWRIAPAAILHAYARLGANRDGDATVRLILEGMKQCAVHGTASAIHAAVLAKTGTAPCDHHPRMPGDGLAIALWPIDSPRVAVLVRQHGVPGSSAAAHLRGLFS